MEAEVVAALIASPVAIAAAVAAYGAGKAQGRAAVDSVRRASQRESYAHLLAASYAFMRSAELIMAHWSRGGRYPEPPPMTVSPEESIQQLDAAGDRINEAAAVVTLDGPHTLQNGART
ncbi:hypothetical protein OH782_42300 (plasmid) [Streptomyces sp. NBC_01544]|uniref:hypothetical protein n=1 Tax=Streptomyces sp. NBC_01544 TaxID=2975871 RepID=UPI0038630B38